MTKKPCKPAQAAASGNQPSLSFNMSLRQLFDSSDRISKFAADRYISLNKESRWAESVISDYKSTGKLGDIFEDTLDAIIRFDDFIRFDEVDAVFRPVRVGWLYLADVSAANCPENLYVISGMEAEAEQFIYTYISTRLQ